MENGEYFIRCVDSYSSYILYTLFWRLKVLVCYSLILFFHNLKDTKSYMALFHFCDKDGEYNIYRWQCGVKPVLYGLLEKRFVFSQFSFVMLQIFLCI